MIEIDPRIGHGSGLHRGQPKESSSNLGSVANGAPIVQQSTKQRDCGLALRHSRHDTSRRDRSDT
jgi:hypothetical protein